MNSSHLEPQPENVKPCVNKQLRYTVLLAPFQPATRIELETNINTNTGCYLDIKNNSDKKLNISVTKIPIAERQITLNLTELEIHGNSSSTINIKWFPKEAGSWRDVLQLTDSRRIKYDIVIATIAKDNKKNKTRRRLLKPLSSLSKLSNLSVPAVSKQFHQKQTKLVKTSTSQPLMSNLIAQVEQYESKYENDLNKENIFNKNNETYASREKDDKINGTHNILSEQNINAWNDGSILPQVLLPSNRPQDIRRTTYLKEQKPYNSILDKHNEEVIIDTACDRDKVQSEFSILLNKFTFTSTDLISSSPETAREESIESASSQITDKHRTFDISHGQFFEISTVCDTKMCINAPSVSQSTDLHYLSPIKLDRCSSVTDLKNLIASSPIVQLQHHDIPKDPNKYSEHFTVDINPNIQITDCEYFSFEVIPENIEAAKKAGDMYIEISPPKKHLCPKLISRSVSKFGNTKAGRITEISPPKKHLCPKLISRSVSKFDNTKAGRITKNKTLCEGHTKKLQLNVPITKKNTKNVAAIKVNKLSLDILRKTKWHAPSSITESSFRIQNKEESFVYEMFKLDPFAPSTTEDPFLKNSTVHHDEQWLLQQELAFEKWLNALLSSPEDLSVDIETTVVDIGKIWQSCKTQKDTVLAETKEAVSARYHTNNRLNTLRKAANAMFNRDQVMQVLSRTSTYIAKGTLCIRSDRNLHRDIGLQKLILGLFLSYNPLWLRIGLETIYNESIPLRSNNDIVGLTRFLLTRFFSNPRLIKMPGYHKTDTSQKFVTQLNQFSLKKFLFLIYFLDYAKQHKLIGHDPCLFHKRAQYKESREILLSFSRELLSGIGDVTRVLRGHNYVLTYRQTYIEEYNYAVVDIRRDLRDGVRLCRAMELITGARGLSQRCRVPAISRLQKVHNVDMALSALRQAGYILEGDIDAKSIADGHCEKTLSLLWQIIHKYQAPRFDRAARMIQRWWRAQTWYIYTRNFLRARRNLAAIIIQRAWRRKGLQHIANYDLEEYRRYLCIRAAAIRLQRWWRRMRGTEKLQELRNRRKAVIKLQKKWKAVLLMRVQRNQYCDLRNAALIIQTRWRAMRAMKLQHYKYLACRNAAVKVQSWWRFTRIARERREWFLRSRDSACMIQVWWKQHLLVRKARNNFLLARTAAQNIERWWIGILDRNKYLLYRKSAILIQRTWRKHRTCKQKTACLKIQTWWRTLVCLHRYKLEKSCCVKLQRWWRGIELAKHQRAEFLRLRESTLILQKNWRARMGKKHYLKQRRATLRIQAWYRCTNSARVIRQRYLKLKDAAIRIQDWWRNIMVARQERRRYLLLRESAIFLQAHWRRRILARADHQRYLTKRKACVNLQSWWRMIRRKREYTRYKICVLEIQRRWRATRAARVARKEYLLTRAAIIVQTRWRNFTARKRFIAMRQAAIVIQSYYRMRIAIRRYKTIKYAASIIQTYWRAYVAGRQERLHYLSLRRTNIDVVTTLQCPYRQKKVECDELHQQQQEDIVSIVTKIQGECEETIQMSQDVTTKLALPGSDYWQEKISVLRSCSSVGMLLTCLSSLDTITKLSPTVCVILCELNLANDIYNTIVQNNRSLPWMKVCLQACSILITLAKYSYTRKYVVKEEYALALVKLLSGSLKEKDVFLHCATLIWLLNQDEDYSKAMMMCPQISWLIKNIQRKILKNATMTKLQKSKDLDKLYPSCEPDRNNMQKPRLFTDMTFAVAAIVKKTYT